MKINEYADGCHNTCTYNSCLYNDPIGLSTACVCDCLLRAWLSTACACMCVRDCMSWLDTPIKHYFLSRNTARNTLMLTHLRMHLGVRCA
jgi:hypothetical protein